MTQDPVYCYDGTDILINLYGLRDDQELKKLERVLTAVRLSDLLRHPLPGAFDLDHLKRIHYYLFQDLYSWAGKLRKVDISKGLMFCHAPYIEKELVKLFAALKQENFLLHVKYEDLACKAAYYMSEINAIHPFRDGNGRTQREFIRELLLHRKVHVDYSKVPTRSMVDASIASFNGDLEPLTALYSQCLSPIS